MAGVRPNNVTNSNSSSTNNTSSTSLHVDKPYDIYRDSFLRYLGYANEVGESFRSLIHVNLVRLSYVVAASYCFSDAINKSWIVHKSMTTSLGTISSPIVNESKNKTKQVLITAGDTLTWQLLASVAIPGFTINRICAFSLFMLKSRTSLPLTRSKWITTAIGLASIPIIIKPIDHSVDWMMDNTLRKHVYKLDVDYSHDHQD